MDGRSGPWCRERPVAAAGIREGATVADVGCGPGAVSARIAGIVGDTGQVWAVDQNETALAAAEELAQRLGHGNMRTHHGEANATGLDPASMDVVVMRHVLAHDGEREQSVLDHLFSLVTMTSPSGFASPTS